MKRISLLLTLLGLGICLSATAQQKTKVYGNLGVENVNISVRNTPNCTTTDTRGHYELPLFWNDGPINLLYSCIGYQDEVFDQTICILAACPNKKTHCLLMTDENLSGLIC